MAATKRRARGEDSIYYDRSRDRWTGTITVGWKPDGRRDRITVRGKTKTEVKDKLRAKHLELAAGIRALGPQHANRLPDHGQAPDRADRQDQARRAEGPGRGLRTRRAG